jgi:putative membrane protein
MIMSQLHRKVFLIALAGALGLGVTCAAHSVAAQPGAQAPATSPAANPANASAAAPLDRHDRKFVATAAEAGAAEVAMGNLAKDRATSPEVKDFAARMVWDHQKAGDQLKAISTGKGMTPSTQLSKKDQAALDKLGKLQGADFDKAYVKGQKSAHRDAVSLFGSEAKSGKDADLKQFATTTLPTLKEHMTMVQQLAKSAPSHMTRAPSAQDVKS